MEESLRGAPSIDHSETDFTEIFAKLLLNALIVSSCLSFNCPMTSNSLLLLLTSNPNDCRCCTTFSACSLTASGSLVMQPSSKYHKLTARLVIDRIASSMAKENRVGPSGSPCWTHVSECRTWSPKYRLNFKAWLCQAIGYIFGSCSQTIFRKAVR